MEIRIPCNVNITMPKTVQEVDGTVAVVAPKSFPFLKIKSSTGGGGARRALTTLGTNNAKLNLSMAHSELALVQEEFQILWNFNPVNEEPLPKGQYIWTAIDSGCDKELKSTSSLVVEKDITLLKDITNPILTRTSPSETSEVKSKSKEECMANNETVLSFDVTKHKESDSDDTSDSENRKQVISPNLDRKRISSKSQTCITEFFRPQKRKSINQWEESLHNTPPKKKLRTIH